MNNQKFERAIALDRQIRAHLKRQDFRAPYRSPIAERLRAGLEAQTFDVGDREPFVQWLQHWACEDVRT